MTDDLLVTGTRGIPTGVDTVVFDFDDTLAETLPARISAMRTTFAMAGIQSPTPEEFVYAQRGIPLQESLDGFDAGRGQQMGLLGLYRSAYWSKERGLLRLFAGVPELITALRDAGFRMGILTSKARDIVVEGKRAGTVVELDELGLTPFAPFTVGYEDVTRAKPHPEGLEMLLGRLGSEAPSTLVVGDSPADILTAHAAGAWSCLAGWGVTAGERDLPAATPDLVAEHPGALADLLTGAASAAPPKPRSDHRQQQQANLQSGGGSRT